MPTPQLGQQPIVQVSLQGMQSPSQVKMSQVVAPPVVIPVPNPHNVIPLITNTQPTTTSSHLRNNSAQSAPFNPYGFNMMGQNFNPHLLKGSFGQNQPVQYPLPSQMAPSYPSTIAPRQNTHYIRWVGTCVIFIPQYIPTLRRVVTFFCKYNISITSIKNRSSQWYLV